MPSDYYSAANGKVGEAQLYILNFDGGAANDCGKRPSKMERLWFEGETRKPIALAVSIGAAVRCSYSLNTQAI